MKIFKFKFTPLIVCTIMTVLLSSAIYPVSRIEPKKHTDIVKQVLPPINNDGSTTYKIVGYKDVYEVSSKEYASASIGNNFTHTEENVFLIINIVVLFHFAFFTVLCFVLR